MTTKNVSRRRCRMFWSNGNVGSLVVRNSKEHRVWTDETCALYTEAIVEETWRAGHLEDYLGRWKQGTQGDRDTCRYDGPHASPGRYYAIGIFQGAGGVRSNRVWFRLR